MSGPVVSRIRSAVGEALSGDGRSLLAISGGVDSMVLFDAAIAVRPAGRLVAATFDHSSGPHGARAVELVQRVAMSASVSVVVGSGARQERPSEASWREARLRFLAAAATEHGARIVMAHNRDDQVETVLFRALRSAGPRGLAGLAAAGSTQRPLLGVTRAEILAYAKDAGVQWLDDPTNLDRAFTRNRLRHELLPMLRTAAPTIEDDLVAIGRDAAEWRASLSRAIDERVALAVDRAAGTLDVPVGGVAGLDPETLGIVWPELLGRVGIAIDHRGTRRIVAFTREGRTGQRIQLSGGWTVHRRRERFEIRRDSGPG